MPPSPSHDLLQTYLDELVQDQEAPGFALLRREFPAALHYLRGKKPQYALQLQQIQVVMDLLHDCVAELLSSPRREWPRGSILRLVGRKAYAQFEQKAWRTRALDLRLFSAPPPGSWTEVGEDPSLIQAVCEPGVRKGTGGIHFERLRLSLQKAPSGEDGLAPTRRGLRARLRALAQNLGRDHRHLQFWLHRLGEAILALAFHSLEREQPDLLPSAPPASELRPRLQRILLQLRHLHPGGRLAKGLAQARALVREKRFDRAALLSCLEDLPHPALGLLALRIELARLEGRPHEALPLSPAPEELHKIPNLKAQQNLLLQRARLLEALDQPGKAARLLERFHPKFRTSPLFLYNLCVLSGRAGLPWVRCRGLDALHRLPPSSLEGSSPLLLRRIQRLLHSPA